MSRQGELDAMSDLEINNIIHELRLSDDGVYVNKLGNYSSRDYCNVPNYIIPIAFENRIGVVPMKNGSWGARKNTNVTGFISYHENPLRAACIVFILMSEDGE